MTGRWEPAPPPVVAPGDAPPAPPQPRLKVLHVITRLDAGAGGNTLLSAVGMDRERYETWIAAGPGGDLLRRAREAGVRVVELPSLRREIAPLADVRTLAALVRLLRAERFAVVHVHSAKAGVLGRVAAAACGTPVVVYTLHGRDPWWPAPDGSQTQLRDAMSRGLRAFLLLERALRVVTDRFVAVSPTVARDAVVARVASPGKVDVAASAVELDRIPTEPPRAVRRELGVADDAPLIGSVGRFDAQKAPLDFVRMAAIVARARPDARFVMVGEGELAEEARRLATELGAPIVFTGQRRDATRIVAALDVFVVSSLYEGVGRALTEAMAAARPVVATAVDGVVDVVAPGATGLLAPPRDPEALAERVRWLLDHEVEAALMGAQARARVLELFSTQRMCATLDAVYSAALGIVPLATQVPAQRPAPHQLRAAAGDR